MLKVAFSFFSNVNKSACCTLHSVLSIHSDFDLVLYEHHSNKKENNSNDSIPYRFIAGEMPVTPFITREVQPTNVLKGANVTLTCIATTSSQSPVEVEWIKDNKVRFPQ